MISLLRRYQIHRAIQQKRTTVIANTFILNGDPFVVVEGSDCAKNMMLGYKVSEHGEPYYRPLTAIRVWKTTRDHSHYQVLTSLIILPGSLVHLSSASALNNTCGEYDRRNRVSAVYIESNTLLGAPFNRCKIDQYRIISHSLFDCYFLYVVGKILYPDYFSNKNDKSRHGIYFFHEKQDAIMLPFL